MKRTYEQSLTFFNTRKTDQRGFSRELYATPVSIIEQIVDSILANYPELRQYTWIDPCAGDGRWERVIKARGINCLSYDIHPLSDTVKEWDFLQVPATEYDSKKFYIGNPPFSLLKQFVNKSLELADICYYLGGSAIITGTLSDKVELLHRFSGAEGNQKDSRSKILFEDTLGKLCPVWCCGAVFDKNTHSKYKRVDTLSDETFAVSPTTHCYVDGRTIELVNRK